MLFRSVFTIYEPKQRQIAALPFRDRVVHHALCRVIEPIWEARFIHDSYACRIGKGTHAGADRLTQFLREARREGEVYVLKMDVRAYFPGVQHGILLQLLARRIRCSETMRLIEEIISSWPVSGTGVGLPIGNLTSQLCANIYLHELDQFAKQDLKAKRYLRYMDDAVIVHNDKKWLRAAHKSIAEFLDEQLCLQLKALWDFAGKGHI